MPKRSRSHIKGKVFKNIKRSPKKKAVLENVYKPIQINFGENKGNNKITELRTILQRESPNS